VKTRRFTYFAAAAIAVDLLVLGAAWHAVPTMSLAASLAVPHLEPILAPLYAEPLTEAPGDFHVYRAARPRATVLLLRDTHKPDAAIIAVARALARRDLTVVVPTSPAADESETAIASAVQYARSGPVPLRINRVSTLLKDTPHSPYARATRAVDVYRIASSLLSPR
jgi:hypothetical protein